MSSTSASSGVTVSSSVLTRQHEHRGWGTCTHTSITHGGVQKVHFTFNGGPKSKGAEMVEEYNTDTMQISGTCHRRSPHACAQARPHRAAEP